MTLSQPKSNLKFRVALFVVAFVMPVVAFSLLSTFSFERSLESENIILTNIADASAQRLQYAADNRRFWCHELDQIFAHASDFETLNLALQKLSEQHDQQMSWIIWDAHANEVINNLKSSPGKEIWERVGRILRDAAASWWFNLPAEDDIFLRNVLGPHFESKTIQRSVFRTDADLSELSYFAPSGSIWADFNERTGLMVLFSESVDNKAQGLWQFIDEASFSESGFALLGDGFFYSSEAVLTPEKVMELREFFRVHAPANLADDRQLVTARYIDENLFLYVFRPRPHPSTPARNSALFALLLAFFWLLVLRETQLKRFNYSIRYVVVGLIAIANLFPLMIMSVFGLHYLEQKRQILIEERRIEAVNFLNRIEGEYVSETHRIKSFAISNIQELGKTLQKEELSEENTRSFRQVMAGVAGKFMVIASTTVPTISDVAFLGRNESYLLNASNTGCLENMPYREDNRIQLNETLCKIGAAFISYYNGTSMSERVLAEVELVVEAIFQSRMLATFHKFLRVFEHVENIGMGMERHPTFLHCLSLNQDKLADYLFMFHFNQSVQAANFMASTDSILQGNAQGVKVLYSTGKSLKNLTTRPFNESNILRELFAKLTYYSQPSADLVELASETWIVTGFVSRIIADNCLLALSPISTIDRRLAGEKNQLLAIMLINILLVAGIALIFANTLLRPVARLQEATQAIRRRDFSFRIGEQGKDEFGQMSRIFDTALRDLEEMSIARDVQQQLFPKQQVDTGDYDMFCKTLTMADLGGDYLDVFPLDEHRFVMILGDVAGHGVGAAMIMAMAKSAMLNLVELLDRPSELLSRLNTLIYRTKTKKQRKIMTFQYIMVDTQAHRVVYANAGGCSPFLIRSTTRSPEEIKVAGAALGAFKNSRFSQSEINLDPGDTLVLYTDGLVESRNNAGEEIGFDGFGESLVVARCKGSQAYYDAIMAANKVWRQDQPRQDDFSLMILQRCVS
ncbi:MAG: SpoIIE family protein phosphatase [Candidatus Riflebacteria bacterium]|nr:SpoIIE family protein phosphatase [Candidatus Riflebacteria bacterium]